MNDAPLLDSAALVGLLADDARRRVVAALVLGASSLEQVAAMSGLGQRQVVTALGRLQASGLVERGGDGTVVLLEGAFAQAARAAASTAARGDDPDAPPETARVLRAFVRDGRLTSIPAQRGKRLVVLDMLAQEFEPGRRYREPMVNLILGRWHADTAALRRYLVDEGFLEREAGIYWRSGGSVPV